MGASELSYICFMCEMLRSLLESLELGSKFRAGFSKVCDRQNPQCCLGTRLARPREKYVDNYWCEALKELSELHERFRHDIHCETHLHCASGSEHHVPVVDTNIECDGVG